MKAGKVALVVVLVIVIVAACAVVAQRLFTKEERPKAPLPAAYAKKSATLICNKAPYTLMTKTLGEWEALGSDSAGHYKDPDTGEYTMVRVIVCAHCGKQIPGPDYPASFSSLGRGAKAAAMRGIDEQYKCPLCGYPAFAFAPEKPAHGKKSK